MNESINLEDFKELMQHGSSQYSSRECCGFYGYKMDEKNGLGVFLGFKENQMSQADYFLVDKLSNNAQIIELTDLKNSIKECKEAELVLSEDCENSLSFASTLNKSKEGARKIVLKKIWSEVIAEFQNKWMGSIAVLERYCRETDNKNVLKYQMLIVLKSGTDPKEIQIICDKLKGMIGNVPVCNSNNIERLLIVKMPK